MLITYYSSYYFFICWLHVIHKAICEFMFCPLLTSVSLFLSSFIVHARPTFPLLFLFLFEHNSLFHFRHILFPFCLLSKAYYPATTAVVTNCTTIKSKQCLNYRMEAYFLWNDPLWVNCFCKYGIYLIILFGYELGNGYQLFQCAFYQPLVFFLLFLEPNE